MITVKLQKAYEAILGALGLNPATAGLSESKKAEIASQINDRVRESYRYAFWPETMVVEERQYRPTWDAATNWAAGDEVFYLDRYFSSIADGNVNHSPPTSGDNEYWTEILSGMIRSIDFQQQGATQIARIDTDSCVFSRDPMVYGMGSANVVKACLNGDQVVVLDSPVAPYVRAKPFVRFQPPEPQFSLTLWDDEVDYGVGDLCFLAAQGECYKALASSTNKNPYTETEYWEPVGFPEFLLKFVKLGVAADRALDEKQAMQLEGKAQMELDRLFDEKLESQKQGRRARFR